jgi:hypothetical protein
MTTSGTIQGSTSPILSLGATTRPGIQLLNRSSANADAQAYGPDMANFADGKIEA